MKTFYKWNLLRGTYKVNVTPILEMLTLCFWQLPNTNLCPGCLCTRLFFHRLQTPCRQGLHADHLYIQTVVSATQEVTTSYCYKALWLGVWKPTWMQDKPHSSVSAVSEERWYFLFLASLIWLFIVPHLNCFRTSV